MNNFRAIDSPDRVGSERQEHSVELADETRDEDNMPTAEQNVSSIRAVKAGWIKVRGNPEVEVIETHAIDGRVCLQAPDNLAREPATYRLFERTAEMGVTFAERFPRLTFAAVALVLLAFTVTAEIEYLRKAGYRW